MLAWVVQAAALAALAPRCEPTGCGRGRAHRFRHRRRLALGSGAGSARRGPNQPAGGGDGRRANPAALGPAAGALRA